MAKIYFQGAFGAYSHLAALEVDPDAEIMPWKTFDDCFNKASLEPECKIIIPESNRITGNIGIEYLIFKHRLNIYKEHFQKIEHNLLGQPGAKLSDIKEVSRLSEVLIEKYDISKVLHLAAPSVKQKNFENLDFNDLTYNINVQLLSTVELIKPVLKKMKKSKQGKIVFILSSYVLGVPPKYTSSYVISKYALLGLLKSLASEYGQFNIQVNGISPSMVETKFISNIHESIIEKIALESPLKRNLLIEEIIPAIKFFLSSESNYINGVNLPLTGGIWFNGYKNIICRLILQKKNYQFYQRTMESRSCFY